MNIGMLRHNPSKEDLATKVRKAAEYYLIHYGQEATACTVNPLMLPEDKKECKSLIATIRKDQGIEILQDKDVPPDYLYIGQK